VKFHEEMEAKAVTEGHFGTLQRRIGALQNMFDEIISFQEYERSRELDFKKEAVLTASYFCNFTVLELVIVAVGAMYSVWSLRRFFVYKAIY